MSAVPRAPRTLLAVLGTAVALVLSGCGAGGLEIRAGSVEPASAASIVITPAPTGEPVAPASRLVVTADAGRLTAVRVVGPDGLVEGVLSVDGRTFMVPGGRLDYDTSYTVEAEAVDRVGVPTRSTTTLQTVTPSAFLGFTMSPREGAVVGVGMPIRLTLDQRLPTHARRAFERTLCVSASDGEGAAPGAGTPERRQLPPGGLLARPREHRGDRAHEGAAVHLQDLGPGRPHAAPSHMAPRCDRTSTSDAHDARHA